MKMKIESLKDLRQKKRILKNRINMLEDLISEDFHAIREDLRPAKVVVNTIKDMFSSNRNGIVDESVSIAVDTIIRKVFFRKSNFLIKTILSFLVKNYTRNLVTNKPEAILDWAHSLLDRLKSKHHHNGHTTYSDRSTISTDFED
jgi:hypothetical protein